jgi:NAD(P)H-hydrate epimerase
MRKIEYSNFSTRTGVNVPAVTAEQMKRLDELAEDIFKLSVLQMMENAGRNLAVLVRSALESDDDLVTVLAGSGGNGGGGLAAARHLHNRGLEIRLVLSRDRHELTGPAAAQLAALLQAGVEPIQVNAVEAAISDATVVIDALIGYSLRGAPTGRARTLIELCNHKADHVISLDVPSGLDATSGNAPGVVVSPQQVLTLALPKTGLADVETSLFLGDIGIPPELYRHLGFELSDIFNGEYVVPLLRT